MTAGPGTRKKLVAELADFFHVHRVETFTALNHVERYFVILRDFVDEAGDVYENFIATVFFDESKTFGLIEEFNDSCFHWN